MTRVPLLSIPRGRLIFNTLIPSVIRPMVHCEGLPVPFPPYVPPSISNSDDVEPKHPAEEVQSSASDTDLTFTPISSSGGPQKITQ